MDVVARYNLQVKNSNYTIKTYAIFKGFQSYLPYLNQGRMNHGCGSYLNNQKLVSVIWVKCLIIL